jgi:DnaJ-class molecular chaperone
VDWYAILELDPGAAAAAIRAAHRRMARRWHPDTNPGPEAHQRMSEVNRAREVLLDPGLRAAYDGERRAVRARADGRAARADDARVHRVRSTVREPDRPGWDPRWAEAAKPAQREPKPGTYVRPAPEPEHERDWYGFLGLGLDATTADVRVALGRLALEIDRAHITASEVVRRRDELRRAWATLGNPTERARYDARR